MNTLENNISSSSDDTQPVKRGRGKPTTRNTPSGGGKMMELMTTDPLTPSISRNTCPLEFLVLCAILVS
jgi:hypothetical protein